LLSFFGRSFGLACGFWFFLKLCKGTVLTVPKASLDHQALAAEVRLRV
jgi:hypothetical protein